MSPAISEDIRQRAAAMKSVVSSQGELAAEEVKPAAQTLLMPNGEVREP